MTFFQNPRIILHYFIKTSSEIVVTLGKICYIFKTLTKTSICLESLINPYLTPDAPVAQLDRASDYGSEG